MTEQPPAPDLADVARRMSAGMRALAGALQVMAEVMATAAAAIESAADYQLAPPAPCTYGQCRTHEAALRVADFAPPDRHQ